MAPIHLLRINARRKAQQLSGAVKVGELYCRGLSQKEIAKELGIHVTTVCKAMKIAIEQWKGKLEETAEEIKAIQLAKIDAVEEEAWQAWERSKKNAIERKRKVIVDDEGKETVERLHGENKRDGDPRWLDLITKQIALRLKVLGILEPKAEMQSGGAQLIEVVISNRDEAKAVLPYMDFARAVDADSVRTIPAQSELTETEPGHE